MVKVPNDSLKKQVRTIFNVIQDATIQKKIKNCCEMYAMVVSLQSNADDKAIKSLNIFTNPIDYNAYKTKSVSNSIRGPVFMTEKLKSL